jgi:hypothetical protein
MITRLISPSLLLLAGLLWISSCQDPISLGADLLDEDRASVGFTDTLQVRARTVMGDPVRTYAPQLINQLRSYLFGDFADPVFGRSRSAIYAQVRPERFRPDFSDSVLDSIVLVLPYDTNGLYGVLAGTTFGMEVLPLAESMNRGEEYFSDRAFATDPSPLAQVDFTPSFDSISVIEYISATVRDTIRFPHLRVHLDPQFGRELLNLDSAVWESDTTWLDYFPGIHLRPTVETPGLISFALNEQTYRGGIYLYYTQGDTVQRQFQLEIDEFSTRMTNYQHGYEGAVPAPMIGDYAAGDTMLFAQGMAGLNTEIEILGTEELGTVIVNKAELEINLHELSRGDEHYPPAERLMLFTREEDGRLRVIDDVLIAASAPSGVRGAFGGVLDEESGAYTMNISAYFQELIINEASPTLILAVFPRTGTTELILQETPKAGSPERVVLNGARHPSGGIRVTLAFTKL